MNENTTQTNETGNKLEELTPRESAKFLHEEIRSTLVDVAEEYSNMYDSGTEHEFLVFSQFEGELDGSIIVSNDPHSEYPYITLSVEIFEETAVVLKRNEGSTDTYCAYVGDSFDIFRALAELIQKPHFEVRSNGGEIDIVREHL